MNLKKSTLSLALASVLSAGSAQAAVIDMDFDGLFTMLSSAGAVLQNTSYPYYGDTTWGYGLRTQITGTMQFDTDTGYGTGTVAPFEFYDGGAAVADTIEFQAVGNGLMIGNMQFNWNGNPPIFTQIVLDGSGLFGAMAGGLPPVGAVLDQSSCAGLPCATPASDSAKSVTDIGPAPIATSSLNVNGATGAGTTLAQLSLGDDDGYGGTPMDNGPFDGFNANFDITSIEITNVSTIPVPAAVWLFGSGLLGLVGVARRRKVA
ncbi:MAG: VPLPA-CTERM sorting domain-containing protein [Gammaproteobacteria bacterium]|nr:VPLPA-CTERM sorting domain-containing protein [Gammaproteobacteria bacterium]